LRVEIPLSCFAAIKITIKATTLNLGEQGTNVMLNIEVSKIDKGTVVTSQNYVTSTTDKSSLINFEVNINGRDASCIGLTSEKALYLPQDTNQKVIQCSIKELLNQDVIQEAPIQIKMSYGFIQSIDGPQITFIKV